jgi:nitrogen-specific signal transduction histidine kinase
VNGVEQSLLAFLDAPVIVGDPDGCAVYLNPAFQARFGVTAEAATGRSLAEFFGGGGREAVLRAVAQVCDHGDSVHFPLRERGVGFAAVASPIVADDARVGVVILLKEELEEIERLLSLHREIQGPIDELSHSLELLLEQTGGRRDVRYRGLVEGSLRALTRLSKWSDEIRAVLSGTPAPGHERASFDPAEVVRRVAERAVQRIGEAGTALELLAARSLPAVRGDDARLESLLMRIVEDRLEQDPPPSTIFIGARPTRRDPVNAVLVSVTEHWKDRDCTATPSEPHAVQEAAAAQSLKLHTTVDPQLGRTTVLRLPVDAR